MRAYGVHSGVHLIHTSPLVLYAAAARAVGRVAVEACAMMMMIFTFCY